MSATPQNYDAFLVVSFGGPEKREDVIPFLENVLRGKPVPRERLLEVAEHYYHFDGVSPINQHLRDLIADLRVEFDRQGISLPIYWGNRNWDPYLADTLTEMQQRGVRRALAFVTSAFSSYSGCRQYREDLIRAATTVGDAAPVCDKIRVFFNHPLFLDAAFARLEEGFAQFQDPAGARQRLRLVFTAHSIPLSMANSCDYVSQLTDTCRSLAERAGIPPERMDLVYQSRSGRPQDPWLEPDILDHLRQIHESGTREVLLVPIGFLSDHMEVLYDLDFEAKQLAQELGLELVRAGTVGRHPKFVEMIGELVREYQGLVAPRASGPLGPRVRECVVDCCPAPVHGRPGGGTRPTS